MSRTGLIILLLANVLIALLSLYGGLREPLSELSSQQTTRRLAEGRLAVKEKNLSAYDNNRQKLFDLNQAGPEKLIVLPYEELADAMAEANSLALRCGLRETAFETQEPVRYDESDSQVLYDVKAYAVYEGSCVALCAYFTLLTENYDCYRIEGLTAQIASDENIGMRLDFAVYGVRDNE